MVASKQNDILTLLNLACIKHTGCPLPVSEFASNNWKSKLVKADSILKKIAVWSPHPYFNPIHLYYPSYDFGARVLRSLVVGEIDFIKNGLQRLQDKLEEESNPYGYQDRRGRPPMMPPQLYFIQNSKPSKINRLFLKDGVFERYPKTVVFRSHPNKHAPQLVRLDRDIMENKCRRLSYDIFTQKGTLRKKGDVAQGIHETRMLSISMSNCSNQLFFGTLHTSNGWQGSAHYLNEWVLSTRGLQEKINKLYIIPGDKLEPEDYIRIYNPKAIDKKKLINQKLIANFPSERGAGIALTQSD